MRWNRLIGLLAAFLLTGCGALKRMIDNSVTTYVDMIIPDSCDINLLKDIYTYRNDSLKFPDATWTLERIQANSKACQASFDSVHIISFEKDSADLFVRKRLVNGNNQRLLIPKYYRIKFVNDSVMNLSPSTKTFNR